MRLFEVADHFAKDLEIVLRNLLGRSDTKKASMTLSYEALSNLMKNMGYGEVDYNGFQKIYDSNPALKAVVKNFDDDGIVLSTDIEPPNDEAPIEVPAGPSVDQMAHSAVAQGLQ